MRKRFFYPLSFAAMLFSSSAMATLHPTAYRGVTEFFLKGKEFYSPTLGETALEAGLIEGIRFNGPFEPAYDKDGKRLYVKDKSKNSLWNIVNILFPSNNGQLGTVTSADSNLGRYVEDTQVISLLLNYTKKLREDEPTDPKTLSQEIMALFKIPEKDKKRASSLKRRSVEPLLIFIRDSIQQEKDGTSLYPTYTTEQILLAFFSYQFNKQNDIWKLLKELDSSIIDKEKPLPSEENHLKEEDIPGILKKPAANPYNIDDVFDLSIARLWANITPYANGLISHGISYFYDRKAKNYIEASYFSNCVETAMRHILNLILFDSIKHNFNLDFIKSKQSKENPYFKDVEEFYEKQTPFLANAGDIGIRSLFNKIVADLNAFGEKPFITYRHKNNEIKSSYINLIRVFQRVFEISLAESPQASIDEKRSWVSESLNTIFSALNPSYEYIIHSNNLFEKESELSGITHVIVNNKENKERLFSFNIYVDADSHMEIKSLYEQKDKLANYKSIIDTHPTTIREGTSEESLWLLPASAFQKKAQHPLYQLYSKPLSDNTSLVEFLKTLNDHYNEWKALSYFQKNISSIEAMMANVLRNISWNDGVIIHSLSPIILSMVNNPVFLKILSEQVKALHAEDLNFDQLKDVVSKLKNLEVLNLSDNKKLNGEIIFTKDFENIKKISLRNNPFQKATFNGLSNLKELRVQNNYNLKELSFTKDLKNFQSLTVSQTGIEEINGLKFLSHLNSLQIDDAQQLKELDLPSELKDLTTVFLGGTGIGQLTINSFPQLKVLGSEDNPNLRELIFTGDVPHLQELDLKDTKNLNELFLPGEYNDLTIFKLSGSGLTKLTVGNLPKIDTLDLNDLKNLNQVFFTKVWGNLKTLLANRSNLESITGLGYLSKVEILRLDNTKNLKVLPLTAQNKNVRILSLSSSGIEHIDEFQHLRALVNLDLSHAKNFQETITLTKENENLEILNAFMSGITRIEGFGYLSNLKKLFLGGDKNFDEPPIFTPNHKNLETFSLSKAKTKNIPGFEHLVNLVDLSLINSDIEELAFTSAHKNLKKLDLSRSKIKNMTGEEHLLNLEHLNLSHFDREKIAFTPAYKNLKTLNLSGPTLTEITGLEHLSNLEVLTLKNTPNLKEFILIKELKNLKHILLINSGITKFLGTEYLPNIENIVLLGASNLNENDLDKLRDQEIVSLPSHLEEKRLEEEERLRSQRLTKKSDKKEIE